MDEGPLLENGILLKRAFLTPSLLGLFRCIAYEEDDERRLGMVQCLTPEVRQTLTITHGEDYFRNGPVVLRHFLICHHLYWSFHQRRVNFPIPMPRNVFNIFAEREGVIERCLNLFAHASKEIQAEVWATLIHVQRDIPNIVKKPYDLMNSASAMAHWTQWPAKLLKERAPETHLHWRSSRKWYRAALDYLESMCSEFRVTLEFTKHNMTLRFPQAVHILALGVRLITGGQRLFDHCIEWIQARDPDHSHWTHTIYSLSERVQLLYRELLRVLFVRRLHLERHWDAAATRGLEYWTDPEGHSLVLIYHPK